MADSQEDRHTIHLLYIGVRKNRRGKKSCLWQKIDPEENTGDPLRSDSSKHHWYDGKNATLGCGGLPGAIISIDASVDERTVYPGTSHTVSRWENEDDVKRWRAESRAAEGEIEDDQRVAKRVREDLVAVTLEPFRHAYWNCSSKRQQSQLLGWIIQQITSPDELKAEVASLKAAEVKRRKKR